MKLKFWWIKERHNPQIGTYYVACGQLSLRDARRYEKPLYGDNVMLRFSTEAAYREKLAALTKAGERVQE